MGPTDDPRRLDRLRPEDRDRPFDEIIEEIEMAIARELFEGMRSEERAEFDRDDWEERLVGLLVADWEGADVDAVLDHLEDLLDGTESDGA